MPEPLRAKLGVTDACADLTKLAQATTMGHVQSPLALEWCRRVEEALGSVAFESVPLHMLLGILATHATTTSFLSQMLVEVALRVEMVCAVSAKAKARALGGLICKLQEIEDGETVSREVMDRRLLQYVLAGQQVQEKHTSFSYATDKAWVGGLPLQATVATVSSGYAILACPAVPGESHFFLESCVFPF